jgi:hypothetical protein
VEAGSCRTVSYRDYYDVMGVSWAQLGSLNAPQAARLGVLPAGQQAALTVNEGETRLTLSPLSGRTGTRVLRLTDADGIDYWLEYRTAAGRDTWLGTSDNAPGLEAGVLLRRTDAFPDNSILLDGTASATGAWDGDFQAALPVGAPVQVSGGDFTVVVESADATGAVVSVVPSPPATPSAPAPAPVQSGAGSVLPGSGSAQENVPPAASEPVAAQAWKPPIDTSRFAHRSPGLEPLADSSSGVGLLVSTAGTALLGATVLLVRRLRTTAQRSR